VLVGLGAPKQERWIADHAELLPSVRVLMGVGGAFDMWGGRSAGRRGGCTRSVSNGCGASRSNPRACRASPARRSSSRFFALVDRT
jgi:hypothetical protein